MESPKKVNPRHEHEPDNLAPGSSGPGEQGYSGEFTVGDEGGAAGEESFLDPTGTGREGGAAVEADYEHQREEIHRQQES